MPKVKQDPYKMSVEVYIAQRPPGHARQVAKPQVTLKIKPKQQHREAVVEQVKPRRVKLHVRAPNPEPAAPPTKPRRVRLLVRPPTPTYIPASVAASTAGPDSHTHSSPVTRISWRAKASPSESTSSPSSSRISWRAKASPSGSEATSSPSPSDRRTRCMMCTEWLKTLTADGYEHSAWLSHAEDCDKCQHAGDDSWNSEHEMLSPASPAQSAETETSASASSSSSSTQLRTPSASPDLSSSLIALPTILETTYHDWDPESPHRSTATNLEELTKPAQPGLDWESDEEIGELLYPDWDPLPHLPMAFSWHMPSVGEVATA